MAYNDPRGEDRSYSGYGNKKTGAGSYSNKSGNGPAVMGGSNSEDKRQRKQGEQVRLGNAYYDKNGAYVVIRKPATETKSTAVTTAAGPTAKITGESVNNSLTTNNTAQFNSGKGNTKTSSAALTSMVDSKASTTKAYDGEFALKEKEAGSKSSTSTVPTTDAYVSMYKNQSPTSLIDYSKSTSTDPNDGKNLSANNNTVAAGPDKFNQEYYAKLKASGMSTSDILDIQKKAPGGNAYSGATVVSEDQKRRANDTLDRVTGSMATLQNGGVTRKYSQSGLFGENIKGEFAYKDGTKITTLADDPVIGGTFNEKTGRIENGVRLGNRQVTTFAGPGTYTGDSAGTGASTTGPQVAVNTMSGGEDGLGGDAVTTTLTADKSTTLTDVLDKTVKLDDIVDAATVTTIITATTTVTEVDKLIEETKDPEILKSLYQRKLSLMRSGSTRTRFAGLLDDPETKKSKMSIV